MKRSGASTWIALARSRRFLSCDLHCLLGGCEVFRRTGRVTLTSKGPPHGNFGRRCILPVRTRGSTVGTQGIGTRTRTPDWSKGWTSITTAGYHSQKYAPHTAPYLNVISASSSSTFTRHGMEEWKHSPTVTSTIRLTISWRCVQKSRRGTIRYCQVHPVVVQVAARAQRMDKKRRRSQLTEV